MGVCGTNADTEPWQTLALMLELVIITPAIKRNILFNSSAIIHSCQEVFDTILKPLTKIDGRNIAPRNLDA